MDLYISNEMLASYLTTVYQNENVRKIISSAQSEGGASSYFQKLGNALAKYYISTGDNTLEGINNVCNLFIQTYMNKTFDDQFMEMIIDKCAEDMGIARKPTIGEKAAIVNLVANRNFNNSFCTHCFPGALYPEVAQNGLDISNEMFKEELSLLEKYFKTGFKTGKLCYCELSEASLSYATQNVPERVKFALGSGILFTKDNKVDSFLFSFRNNLIRLVENGSLSKNDYYKVFEAGKKLIEFYCANEQSAIAIFRNDRRRQDYSISLFDNYSLDATFRGTFVEQKILEIIKKCQDAPNRMSTIIDEGLSELESISPKLKEIAEGILNERLNYKMKNMAVKNYMHGGYADGHEVESGKLLPSEFAITVCPCPIDLWNKEHKNIIGTLLVNNPVDKGNLGLICKEVVAVERILAKAASEEVTPNNIECIHFGKSVIPIYSTNNVLVFTSNYLIGSQNGYYLVSLFNEKIIMNRAIQTLRNELLSDANKVSEIITQYKLTDSYDPDFEENLEDDATLWFAKTLFNSYDEATKKQMIQVAAANAPFITIKKSESGYVISHGQECSTVLPDVLVDSNASAPYNNLYSRMIEAKKNKNI